MKVTIRASTGAGIVVWRERDSYYARRLEEASEPQICLAVDLFEVIAELAELDLERADQAAEALALSEDAQRELPSAAVAEAEGSDAAASVTADDRRDAS